MKSVRALPPMALRAWLFGLELPCSRRLSRLWRCGHGDRCSLHDSQLQLGGPVGVGSPSWVAGPCSGWSDYFIAWFLLWCLFLSMPGAGYPHHCLLQLLATHQVACMVCRPSMSEVRQLSRGCVGDDLASSDPWGTSRWSRLVFKERRVRYVPRLPPVPNEVLGGDGRNLSNLKLKVKHSEKINSIC